MKIIALIGVLGAIFSIIACNGEPAAEPTPNIDATIEAGIRSTQESESAMNATVAAQATATTSPTATPNPTPTPTPAPTATPTPQPTLTPRPTPVPTPTPTPHPTIIAPVETLSLPQYADRFAGGPGAIYIDDLSQLAGPSVYPEFMDRYGISLGDDYGNVPLYALQQGQWIYESDYYQSLLTKARLTDPTELASSGERIIIEHACINRALLQCQLLESYFVPNVIERTNGQVIIQLTSFPELGMSGVDTAELLANGTMPMAELYGGYIGYNEPVMAMPNLWGLWPDHRTHFAIHTGIAPDMDRVVSDVIDSQPLMRNWIAGDDQYIFSDRSLDTLTDFRNLKTRSHSAEISDWINSTGAEGQFVSLVDVYLALERNILEASVAGANVGLSQRWYEVTSHINGPLYSFSTTINAINGDVWHYIPQDLQQILIEEGSKYELESLRLASIQNLTGLRRNIDAGLEFVEFSPEIRNQAFRAARENVLPGWLQRLGYPQDNQYAVDIFNEKIAPLVGLRIEPNGSIATTPITAGPRAGKTMAEVLSEVTPATILPPPIPQPTPTPTPPAHAGPWRKVVTAPIRGPIRRRPRRNIRRRLEPTGRAVHIPRLGRR